MRLLFATAWLALATLLAAATPPAFAPDALLAHIKFLASDDLKGRDSGSAGLERAAEYIADQFAAAGLRPGGKDGGWFQPFELVVGLTIGEGNSLGMVHDGRTTLLALGDDYYPLAATANESPGVPSTRLEDVPVVFAGYGLVVPGPNGYDDYADVDVSGKAVLIFSHEPQEQDPNSRFNGARPMAQTTLRAKATAAREHGARALLVVADPSHRTDDAQYDLFRADPDAEDHGIPVLRIRRSEVSRLVDELGLDALARRIDADLVPRSRALPGVSIDYEEHFTKNRKTVRNVVGMLPGNSVRGREAVVIGAHYDHVGLGGRLSLTPNRTGEVHNGADDNASGTAAVIEMARAAVAERSRFPRTLVFVAFASEERGLLGSAHYVQDPPIPVANTIAMLNLDMVGRAKGSVDVSGAESAPALEADLQAAVKASGEALRIRRQGPGAGRSDDASFLEKGIPAINFFTGFHDDYHRPGDDWQKIDAIGTIRVATLALELAARIASLDQRPAFVAPAR